MQFAIADDKLQRIIELVREFLPSQPDAAIEAFCLADWPEGQEHQDWLNKATAEEIADWAIAGLR